MSHNKFRFEETKAIRQAVDMVLHHLGDADDHSLRAEIARVVLSIAQARDYGVDALVILTIEKLGEPVRRSA